MESDDKISFIKQLTNKFNSSKSSSKAIPTVQVQVVENKINEVEQINPDWFEAINQQTINSWEKALMKSEIIELCVLIKSDDRILNQELTHSNKKIIFNDSERTRVKDRKAFPEFRNLIEKALTLYCEDNKISYKQGLNEVLAPFLFLTKRFDLSLTYVYNLFSCFVKRYLTNFYIDEDLYTLKSSIGLLNILLRYHDPMLYYIFDFCCIAPEMYATNWILTLFFSKCSLKIAYCLIDIITLEDDELFIFFYLTAFLSYKKNEIISVEQTRIPVALSTLAINSIEECESIYILACEFKNNTPYSFRLYVDYLELFKFKKEKELKSNKKVESLILMPFFPSEVLFYTYSDIVKCPNWKCKNFINTKEDYVQTELNCFFCLEKEKTKRSINSEESELELLKKNSTSSFAERINTKKSVYIKNQIMNPLMLTDISIKKVNIMILDLRQEYNEGEEDEKKSGFLPLTISPQIKDFQEKNVGITINCILLVCR